MMSVSAIIDASASGIITQPAAATMPSSVVSLLTSVTASLLPAVWASAGPIAAKRHPAERKSRFMSLLRPLTLERRYRFTRSEQDVGRYAWKQISHGGLKRFLQRTGRERHGLSFSELFSPLHFTSSALRAKLQPN